MGRKPDEDEARTANVLLRVLESERATWKSAAAKKGLTVSAWLRGLANKAAERAKKSKAAKR